MGEKIGDYFGVPIENLNDLKHIPIEDLKSLGLFKFFKNEKQDEFLQVEGEDEFKGDLSEGENAVGDDLFASLLAKYPEKKELLDFIKKEYFVLSLFSESEVDYEELYKVFDFADMPNLKTSVALNSYIKDKLMLLFDIDIDLFKQCFYQYDYLQKEAAKQKIALPLRKFDIVNAYKKAGGLKDLAEKIKNIQGYFDDLLEMRRKLL